MDTNKENNIQSLLEVKNKIEEIFKNSNSNNEYQNKIEELVDEFKCNIYIAYYALTQSGWDMNRARDHVQAIEAFKNAILGIGI